jgi:hypothetical protein
MREPLEIITNIRDYISSNNVFRFSYLKKPILNLLNELESTLYPVEEVVVVEETPVAEEAVTEEIVTEEEITIEDIQTEDPVTETTPKRKR